MPLGSFRLNSLAKRFVAEENFLFDISNASLSSESFDLTAFTPRGITWNNDGSKLFIADTGTNQIVEFTTSNYNISNLTQGQNTSNILVGGVRMLTTNPDGTMFFTASQNSNDRLYRFNFSSGFNLSTYTNNQNDFYSGNDTGIQFNSDGTKMYLLKNNDNTIRQYNMSSPYAIGSSSSTTVTQYALSNIGSLGTVYGFKFNHNGTRMFVYSENTNRIYQIDLSSPYDLTTATYNNVNLNIASSAQFHTGFTFNADGTKLYTLGALPKNIRVWNLS